MNTNHIIPYIEYLIESSANTSITDSDGNAAWQYAGTDEIREVLQSESFVLF